MCDGEEDFKPCNLQHCQARLAKGSTSHMCFPVTPQLIHPQRATIKNPGKTPHPIPESPSEDTQPWHIPIPTEATLVTQYSSLSEHF